MKKAYRYGFMALSLLCLCAVLHFGSGATRLRFAANGSLRAEDGLGESGAAVFHLPASLRTIEDEAFLGTAPETVLLPEAVTRIGSRAFADMSALREVGIPASAQFIAADAFGGTPAARLYGVAGSYAEKWAETLGYAFIRKDVWIQPYYGAWAATVCFMLLFALSLSGEQSGSGQLSRGLCRRLWQGRTRRRKERPELHAQDGYFP